MTNAKFAGPAAVVVCLLASCLAAPPVHAKTSLLKQSGNWEAFDGTTTDGRPVCGMSATVGDRYLGLKLFKGLTYLVMQLGTKEWKINKGEKIGMRMQFDARPMWSMTGSGMHFSDGDAGLEVHINVSQADKLMTELRGAKSLHIEYLSGNIANWQLELAGTNVVGQAFDGCRAKLN